MRDKAALPMPLHLGGKWKNPKVGDFFWTSKPTSKLCLTSWRKLGEIQGGGFFFWTSKANRQAMPLHLGGIWKK